MNIKALQAFQAVITEGSVSGAARAMHLSQPAVSRLIAVLEAELRLTLFKREKKRLLLTEEGAAFNREAHRILAGLREIPAIADEIRSHRPKRLRMVTMPRTALSVVAPAVARFAKEYPQVKLSLDVRSHRDIESWINGREYDLSFGNVPISFRAARSTPLVRAQCLRCLCPRIIPSRQNRKSLLKIWREKRWCRIFQACCCGGRRISCSMRRIFASRRRSLRALPRLPSIWSPMALA